MPRKKKQEEGNDELEKKGAGIGFKQLELLADIEAHEPDAKSIYFGHSLLTACLYPVSEPKPGTDYVSKRNGNLLYVLEAGLDTVTNKKSLPSGKYARLIMAWLSKQIRAAGDKKTDNVDPETRTVVIPSMYTLLADMGIPRGGRTAAAVQEQLRLLMACRISIRRTTGFSGRKELTGVQYVPIIEKVYFVDDKSNSMFSGAAFVMAKDIYDRLAKESAPFDMRASSYLLSGRSCLPYDLFIWLNGSMKELKHPLPVSWQWLRERFGEEIARESNFRYIFKKALAKVKEVYPSLNVEVNRNGLMLFPSPTTVAPRGQKRQWLPADEGGKGGEAPENGTLLA